MTAVDTNVILDVLAGEDRFGPASVEQMARCADEGSLVVGDVVWAEVLAWYASPSEMEDAMAALGVDYLAPSSGSAALAGTAWREYRAEGGPRSRLVSDFLVGGHAMGQADRLLTRDRGFFRKYFRGLTILDPSSV